MAEEKKNFWSGEEEPREEGEGQAAQVERAEATSMSSGAKWGLAGGVAAIVIILVAVLINANLGTGADGSVDTSEEIASTIKLDNGDQKINWGRYGTTEVELSESLTITQAGTYHLTGELKDGVIVVDAAAAEVRLILDNATIKNSSGPAIACYAAEDLVIELVGTSTVEDGTTYSADYDEDVKGAIYSKDDLSFTGEGTLRLTAHYEDGIVSKDDLKINSGTYIITAADDGIRGKDSVHIVAGKFTIDAKGDAIKSTEETKEGKGYVLIEDGEFAITAGAKGIKATNSVLIYDGTYNIKSTDDGIHSNNYVGVANGEITITAGDDGIHADRELLIDGGTVTIAKSYEGLEAQAVTINGGTVAVTASDDGINAGGGADSSAMNRAGAGAFDSDEACILMINGGEVYVNASGDGVDSNGYIYFNGGKVVIDGPTNNGDGALDSGISIVMNGGEVIAVGASGMAETLGGSSRVYSASIYFSSTQVAGTKVEIKNSAGTVVASHTSAKTFAHMAVGSEAFKAGETYTIHVNGSEYESFTISDTVTTVGNSNGNFMNMGGGRR